jgi:hypothetical protein
LPAQKADHQALRASRAKPGRIAVIVVGALLALPALALIAGGTALTVAYATQRDDDGYFDATLDRLSTATAAITTEEADLRADPGPPDRVLDFVDFSVRIQTTRVDQSSELFIGIGPAADVENYLNGVARDEIRDVEADGDVEYRSISGIEMPAPPAEQEFWVASASGAGTQELIWEFSEGRWSVVLMNADASPGILAEATVGIRSGALLPFAISILVAGALLLAVAVSLIVVAARGRATESAEPEDREVEAAAPPVLRAMKAFFGVAVSGRSYRNYLYLALSFPLGLAYFVFLVTGLSVGVGLVIIWVGIPILLLVLVGWWAMCVFERQLAVRLLRVDIPPMSRTRLSGSVWTRLRAHLRNPVTWKGLVYLLVKFPFGVAAFSALVTTVALASLVAAPVVYSLADLQIGFWEIDTLGEASILPIPALLSALVLMHLMNGAAFIWGRFARLMLGTPPSSVT